MRASFPPADGRSHCCWGDFFFFFFFKFKAHWIQMISKEMSKIFQSAWVPAVSVQDCCTSIMNFLVTKYNSTFISVYLKLWWCVSTEEVVTKSFKAWKMISNYGSTGWMTNYSQTEFKLKWKNVFFYCLLFLFVCFDFKMFLKNISVEKMRQELAGVIILGGGVEPLLASKEGVFQFENHRSTGLKNWVLLYQCVAKTLLIFKKKKF